MAIIHVAVATAAAAAASVQIVAVQHRCTIVSHSIGTTSANIFRCSVTVKIRAATALFKVCTYLCLCVYVCVCMGRRRRGKLYIKK